MNLYSVFWNEDGKPVFSYRWAKTISEVEEEFQGKPERRVSAVIDGYYYLERKDRRGEWEVIGEFTAREKAEEAVKRELEIDGDEPEEYRIREAGNDNQN